jgi:hypothetical protein
MTDDPQRERIAHLLEQLGELPFDERETFLAELSEPDREAVWAAELEAGEEAIPDDYEDLGAGD